MKTQREVMIDSLVGLVDDWTLEQLLEFAKIEMFTHYDLMSNEELEEEYMDLCAAQEYPETFPEGYNEP